MPWCDECDAYLTPNAMTVDGDCPRCGEPVADGPDRSSSSASPAPTDVDLVIDEKAPWHFKLMVVAAAVYLVWRFVAIFT